MNVVVLVGRLTRDPEVRRTQDGAAVAAYSLAVDRRFKKDGGQDADFIRCIAFGKIAEFVEKYFTQGMRVSVQGHIRTGSYKNKDGRTVYTTDVVVDQNEFAQSKGENTKKGALDEDDFMEIPKGIEDELPFPM